MTTSLKIKRNTTKEATTGYLQAKLVDPERSCSNVEARVKSLIYLQSTFDTKRQTTLE